MDSSSVVRWLRLAFNCKKWKTTKTQWLKANGCIQEEELKRIEKFVFQQPAVSSMVGRLMLRKGIQVATGIRNADIKLLRTEEGRPYMDGLQGLDLNVSHHGDFVVLALEDRLTVGVDVMSLDRPINIELDEYFRLMKRQFTPEEWRQIDNAKNRLYEFYRFWCLKESYVKATGVGLNLDLQTISFNTTEPLCGRDLVTSTTISVRGKLENQWRFEESLLDDNHCVAVCSNQSNKTSSAAADSLTTVESGKTHHLGPLCREANFNEHVKTADKQFSEIDIEDILNDMEIINNNINMNVWTNFSNKQFSAR